MKEIFKSKKILIVVAHPDDELLGLGATMNKLIKEQGCYVKVVILGEGITSRADKRDLVKFKRASNSQAKYKRCTKINWLS